MSMKIKVAVTVEQQGLKHSLSYQKEIENIGGLLPEEHMKNIFSAVDEILDEEPKLKFPKE